MNETERINGASIGGVELDGETTLVVTDLGELSIQGISGARALDGGGLVGVTIEAGAASAATDAYGSFGVSVSAPVPGTSTARPSVHSRVAVASSARRLAVNLRSGWRFRHAAPG